MFDALLRMVGLGKLNTVVDGGNAQMAQVQLTSVETRDGTPVLGLFGVISNAPDGSDAVFLAHGGDRSRVVIATGHQASRFRNAPRGAGGVYDQVGSYLILSNDTNGRLVVSGNFDVINGSNQCRFNAQGLTVTGGGNVTVVGGDVIADGISLKNHIHTSGGAGSPTSKPIG